MLPLIVALVLGSASPAAAVPVDWVVTPGGSVTATGGDVVLEIEESELQWYCESLALTGVARSGTGDSSVVIFPESPGATFTNCTGPVGIVPEYTQIGDWEMHAESYDPVADEVSGTIRDVAFDWVWAGCNVVFQGTLNYRYSNSSGQLVILPDPTLTDIYVDPVNSCLGLVLDTDTASLDNTSSIVPPIQIVPS